MRTVEEPTPAQPEQSATPSAASPRYQVKRGETLAQIAARHDTTVTQLIALNKLRKPYRVTTGQQLVLPAAPAAQTSPAPAVAKATLTPPAPVQQEAKAPRTQAAQVSVSPETSTRYQVKRGETLTQIAARHDTTVAQLITLNKLRKPYKVTIGQQLVLPAAPAPQVDQKAAVAKAARTPPAPAESSRPYQVKRGETLAQIAARHDTTVTQLITLNKLRRPYRVTTGQQLVLPAAPAVAKATLTPPAPAESSRPYQVKRGETLTQIAARHDTTVTQLITLNKLRKPYRVTAGQKLVVPGLVATPSNKARPQPVVQKRYRVRQGDTLATIADRFETTIANLITVNELRRPFMIKPGQVLLLPQPSPEAAVPDEGGKRLWRLAAAGDPLRYATA
jgi:LysM repeat protein